MQTNQGPIQLVQANFSKGCRYRAPEELLDDITKVLFLHNNVSCDPSLDLPPKNIVTPY